MSQRKDIDELQAGGHDRLLVELLYGELEGDTEAQAMERVDGDTLGEMQRVRDMFRELPDEEPPAACVARLMHLATQHAPASSAGKRAASSAEGGVLAWIAGLFRPIAMYPGLAAAASLMLMVGVAGTLYISGRPQFAGPTMQATQTPAPAAAELGAASADPASAEQAVAPGALDDSGGTGAREQAMAETREALAGAPADLGRPPMEDAPADLADDDAPAATKKQTARAAVEPAKDTRRRARASAAPRHTDRSAPARRAARSHDSDELALGSADTVSPRGEIASEMQAAPPASAGAPAPGTSRAAASRSAPAQAPASAGGGGARKAGSAAPRTDALQSPKRAQERQVDPGVRARIRSLHAEARAAAGQNDCASVREIAGRIRALDAIYYREQLRREKLLAPCLQSSPD